MDSSTSERNANTVDTEGVASSTIGRHVAFEGEDSGRHVVSEAIIMLRTPPRTIEDVASSTTGRHVDDEDKGRQSETVADITLSTPPPITNEYSTPTIDNLLSSQDITTKFSNKSLHPIVGGTSASVQIGTVKSPTVVLQSSEVIPLESVESANPGKNSVAETPQFPSTPNIVNLSDVDSIEDWVNEGKGNHVYIGRKVDTETQKYPGSKYANQYKLRDYGDQPQPLGPTDLVNLSIYPIPRSIWMDMNGTGYEVGLQF